MAIYFHLQTGKGGTKSREEAADTIGKVICVRRGQRPAECATRSLSQTVNQSNSQIGGGTVFRWQAAPFNQSVRHTLNHSQQQQQQQQQKSSLKRRCSLPNESYRSESESEDFCALCVCVCVLGCLLGAVITEHARFLLLTSLREASGAGRAKEDSDGKRIAVNELKHSPTSTWLPIN